MKIFSKNQSGMTFVELIISIAIFSQIILVVGMVVMKALEFNEFNKATKSVNIELYSSVMNGIGPYIRKATGIMYDDYTPPKSVSIEGLENIKTSIHTSSGEKSFDRTCKETDSDIFDRITLFQDKEKKEYITFAVEKDPKENTSRLVWKKNNEPAFYLTSENTYVSCFLVAISPNPYKNTTNKNAKDVQPYIQIALAGKYRYINDTKDEDFLKKNTYTSYKTTFTLRNYSY